MSYEYDYLVFIGRFQPFHIGHKQVIETALSKSSKVIVCIGSANQPRTIKNPWTASERTGMIFDGLDLPNHNKNRVMCVPISDQAYNDQKWAASVQEAINDIVRVHGPNTPKIGIIGHSKDESSYYLKMFPQWGKPIEHGMNEKVSATDIRRLYFTNQLRFLEGVVPKGTLAFISQFAQRVDYTKLVKEFDFIEKYKRSWEAAPYPPTFVTVDAVVIQSGHVLLVERKAAPGEGLLALAGGFVNQSERLEDAVLRELREETKLKVPMPVLRGSIKKYKIYDDPGRSLRGRTITVAYLIELPPGELPPVKGGDDARKAMWVPLSLVDEERMFEDHYSILMDLTG